MNDLHEKTESLERRLSLMEDGTNRTNTNLEQNTKAVNELVTQLAVYISKHEAIEEEIKTIRSTQIEHGQSIAAMSPVVEGMRGLMWKIVGATLLGGGGIAAVIIGTVKTTGVS